MLQREPDRFELLLRASENLLTKSEQHDQEISDIRRELQEVRKVTNRFPGDSRMQINLKIRATKHVSKLLGGPGSSQYNEYFKKYISRLWHDYWNAFSVTTYKDTPAALYDEAISFIDKWRPLELAGLEETMPEGA